GFTPVTGATDSVFYTSNSVTISGLTNGLSIPLSISGTNFSYSKSTDGGATWSAFTTANGTVQNGDMLQVQGETLVGTSVGTITFNPGTVHSSTAAYSIADNSVTLTTTTGTSKYANLTVSGSPPLTATGSVDAKHQGVRAAVGRSGNKRVFEFTVTTAAGTN